MSGEAGRQAGALEGVVECAKAARVEQVAVDFGARHVMRLGGHVCNRLGELIDRSSSHVVSRLSAIRTSPPAAQVVWYSHIADAPPDACH